MNILIAVACLVAVCLPSGYGWGSNPGRGGNGGYQFPQQPPRVQRPIFNPQPQKPIFQRPQPVFQPQQPNFNNPQRQRPAFPTFPTFGGPVNNQPPQDPWWNAQNPGRNGGNNNGNNQDPWWNAQNPGRNGGNNNGNQCQTLANRGDCGFYDCFNGMRSTCSNQGNFFVQDLSSVCRNTQQQQFSTQGQRYINSVRQCQAQQMSGFVDSRNCGAINTQAQLALFGTQSGSVGTQDCYWQNGQYCDFISNSQNNNGLAGSLFGNNNNNQQSTQVAQHLRYLATQCNRNSQNVFDNNFVARCPPGTIGRINPPMMMMGGAGGD